MNHLDNIDDNYLTKISGLIIYDRSYLTKNSEKLFFSTKCESIKKIGLGGWFFGGVQTCHEQGPSKLRKHF